MKLHVISFDVPWPANYGGVIDVYNRLEALNEYDFKVILHAFDYGRGEQSKLSKLCSEVHYYKRKNRAIGLLKKDPMIISTRYSKELLQRLQEDDFPILFEGQHTTAFLDHPSLKNRKKLVRLHNVEHEYYSGLINGTTGSGKTIYFKREAEKLKQHEQILNHADQLLCITEKDTEYYQNKFGNATYLPVAIRCEEKKTHNSFEQPYFLYHGNLSVEENISAVKWLLENVCQDVVQDFIFAGKDPSRQLEVLIAKHPNVSLIENPSQELMQKLIISALAHVFYTNQATGIKIKLLNALCTGRPIFCNSHMVEGTGLDKACIVNDDPKLYVAALKQYINGALKGDVFNPKDLLDIFSYNGHVNKLKTFLQ